MRCADLALFPARPPRPLAHGKVPGPDVSPGPPAGHEGLSSRRHFIFFGFLRRERAWGKFDRNDRGTLEPVSRVAG